MTKTTKAQALIKADSLYNTQADIEKAIVSTRKKVVNIQIEYQRIAISVAMHVVQHRELTLVNKLFESMKSTGLNLASMKKWFDEYAPVTFTEKGELIAAYDKPFVLATAMEKAWWLEKTSNEYVPFNDLQAFLAFFEKFDKKVAKSKPEKGDSVNPELYNAIRAVVEQFAPPVTEGETIEESDVETTEETEELKKVA